MRKISKIVCHHTATQLKAHDNIRVLREWHLDRGFDDVGYHYFIGGDGKVSMGRPIAIQGAHCLGENHESIAIALHGLHYFNRLQFVSLGQLTKNLLEIFNLSFSDIYLHKHLAKTECPNYEIEQFKEFTIG